jgi:hypothetical protein
MWLPGLVKVVINAVEGQNCSAAVFELRPESLIYLELEPWQWQSFTVGMIFSDKAYYS